MGEVNPSNGKLYFTHTDLLGTPQKLTDSTKATAWSATYAPFGNTVSFSGTLTTQSIRLTGQYFDPEAGMNHNGFRDYSAAITRYVQTDPIGLAAGTNTYQYVKGNPFKFTDPTGLDPAGAPASGSGSGGSSSASAGGMCMPTTCGFPTANNPLVDFWTALYNAQPGNDYLDRDFIKAMIMVEGNTSSAYYSDPMQVNNMGDWDPYKSSFGLDANTSPGASLSIEAGIGWLDYKAYTYDQSGTATSFKGWFGAAQSYNGGGDPNYIPKLKKYYGTLKKQSFP